MHSEPSLLSDTGLSDAEKAADAELDVAEEDSFPASDPPSITDPAKTIKDGEQTKKP